MRHESVFHCAVIYRQFLQRDSSQQLVMDGHHQEPLRI